MCDSRAHDIKHLTGIMLGSRGVFIELVESLFAADNATALFKLTYDSHMCILARKVTFDKLRTELDCIGKHRELWRPASDFAEVDWESLDFGSIGEAFWRAAPATTELVEQLCGVTAVTADCPARSRGRYTGGSAVGDAEDHWGLDSPAPLEKRKMISVVAMSLLGYANSQRANILQAYQAPIVLFSIAWRWRRRANWRRLDSDKVQDERIHNKNIQHNNTVGAVVFLKTQQGDPWPKRLPQDKQTLSRAEQLPNLLDDHLGDQSRPYTLAPEQWWIRLEEIGDFTTHDVLAPLFESVRTYMPRIFEAMICDTLWSFAGAEMGSKDGRGGQELLRFEPPEVYKLFPTRIDAAPMKAFDLDEASISGNSQILDAIIHELDLDTDKLGDGFLVPISGDQLTVQRLRSLKCCNLQASSGVVGCIDIDVRAGLFHLRMAAFRMIYDAHGGSDGCRNPLSLKRLGGILGRTKVFSPTGHMDFYAADALLRHVTDALIIVAVMAHIKVGSVEEMRTRMTSLDWRATITEVVKKWIPPTSVHFNRKEKTIEERDALLENAGAWGSCRSRRFREDSQAASDAYDNVSWRTTKQLRDRVFGMVCRNAKDMVRRP
ncbi:hypothetical protein K440DRAFT_646624 [Wilcoxina mikolae CBS 423.85]|nr:hypothetical protein K440DRAFT_646624 [Wilcoxina mikolae CBS 423.85]